jgi:hypothetical protein
VPSSRRSSRRPYGTHIPLDLDRVRGGLHYVTSGDGEWAFRTVTSADKTYRCPGCLQEIPPGVSHVVAWARDAIGGEEAGLDARRHWHGSCWNRRDRLR